MKSRPSRLVADTLFVAGACLLLFGCISSSLRTARTLEPNQGSIGAGFMNVQDMDNTSSDPINLLSIDGRISPAKQFDIGLMHTWDLTSENDGMFATGWADVKVQLTNPSNSIYGLTFATGLIKGYVYHERAKTHVTSIPLMFSFPLSETVTPTFQYRHEFLSENFFPDNEAFKNPRSLFSLGVEFTLREPQHEKWTPKLGVSIGTFSALDGRDGDRGLMLNIGFSIDSPIK